MHFSEDLPVAFSRRLLVADVCVVCVRAVDCRCVLSALGEVNDTALKETFAHLKSVRRPAGCAATSDSSTRTGHGTHMLAGSAGDGAAQWCEVLLCAPQLTTVVRNALQDARGALRSDTHVDIAAASAVCPPLQHIVAKLEASPNAAHVQYVAVVSVPVHAPHTLEQAKSWSRCWPVVYRRPAFVPMNLEDTNECLKLEAAVRFVEDAIKDGGGSTADYVVHLGVPCAAVCALVAADGTLTALRNSAATAAMDWRVLGGTNDCGSGIRDEGAVQDSAVLMNRQVHLLSHPTMLCLAQAAAYRLDARQHTATDDNTFMHCGRNKELIALRKSASMNVPPVITNDNDVACNSKMDNPSLVDRPCIAQVPTGVSEVERIRDATHSRARGATGGVAARKRDRTAVHSVGGGDDAPEGIPHVPLESLSSAQEMYLCKGCIAVVSSEPCVMCVMALVHSRVALVVVLQQCSGSLDQSANKEFGGLGGYMSVHRQASLNHSVRVVRARRLHQ